MQTSAPASRIAALDHIRGLSILGILMVNAIAFAMPMDIYSNPTLSPLPLTTADIDIWSTTEIFFTNKFVTLFSLLFGISIYLVGQTHRPGERLVDRPLFRRLAWLVVFGIVHGALIWHGDILLLYALTGFIFWRWRASGPRTLIASGLVLFVVGALAQLAPLVYVGVHYPGATQKVDDTIDIITQMRGPFWGSLSENARVWWSEIGGELVNYAPQTLGLMMLGLGLFKVGVLSGQAKTRIYLALVVAAAVSLGVIAWSSSLIVQSNFDFPDAFGLYEIANTLLCLPVALGYASVLILVGRSGAGRVLLYPLACAGRMAFSNYIAQSVMMTMIFYGGRGWEAPLFGTMNTAALIPIVLTVWAGQLIVSTVWMSVLRYGPLEWLWRCLTYRTWVGITR